MHTTLDVMNDIQWEQFEITKADRSVLMNQKPRVLWFTGLSGSGKSTIANALDQLLFQKGFRTVLLDGDNLRHGLNSDLGFSNEDRVENLRRTAEVAKLMADAGLVVIVSLISPFKAQRQFARDLIGNEDFIEIFVDTPFAECARRDPKGLYKKAMAGQIKDFTGVSSAYEIPAFPDLSLRTMDHGPNELAHSIYVYLTTENER